MNPHGDPRALQRIKDAANKRKRRQNTEYRRQDTAQWRARLEQPGVLEHKAIQRATAREEPGRRDEEQVANTA